jgi:hypothetical protein
MGFKGVDALATGRPSYHPSVMLKIYIYGYLNRIQSSRRLEREAQRNIELMWLTRRLMPDHKTIANFRKDKAMDTADREEPEVAEARTARLKEKIAGLKEQMEKLKDLEAKMNEAPDQQISLTDPDARSMATSGRGSGLVGYNVQAAVDAEHHLIVAFDVTNSGSDRDQLSKMANQVRDAMGVKKLTAVADRGYFKGEEIVACETDDITTYVPKPLTSGAKAEGRFGKQDFIYIPEDDEYLCPAGERLKLRYTNEEGGKTLHCYWSSVCQSCAIKAKCMTPTSQQRRVKRWEHEAVLETMQRQLDLDPTKMRVRRSTVEHPFGTIKSWMGATHFLTKTLDRVSTEMSLHVLAYNFKRVMNLLGTAGMIEAMKT